MSYLPSLGTFNSRDPVGYVDGLNTYQFERSNPVNLLDPMGTAVQLPNPESPNWGPVDPVTGQPKYLPPIQIGRAHV